MARGLPFPCQLVRAAGSWDAQVRALYNSRPGGMATVYLVADGALGVAGHSTGTYYRLFSH